MPLRKQLARLVKGNLPEAVAPKRSFAAETELRAEIKKVLERPLDEFCRNRLQFDTRHGLVYKLLKTDRRRTQNDVLANNDMLQWLRRDQIVPALWVVRLAGASHGQFARNRLLQWLRKNRDIATASDVLKWTKKWGIKEDEHATAITASAKSVGDARKQYQEHKDWNAQSRQILGNTLLGSVARESDPDEVFAFFKTLNKDVYTFTIMLSAMNKNPGLLTYKDQVWDLAQRQQAANNIQIDDKLRKVYTSLANLPLPGQPGPDPEFEVKLERPVTRTKRRPTE